MSVRIVVGEDLKRLAALRHQTAADVAYALADLSVDMIRRSPCGSSSISTEKPGV
jgi:hypothetical protein